MGAVLPQQLDCQMIYGGVSCFLKFQIRGAGYAEPQDVDLTLAKISVIIAIQ